MKSLNKTKIPIFLSVMCSLFPNVFFLFFFVFFFFLLLFYVKKQKKPEETAKEEIPFWNGQQHIC